MWSCGGSGEEKCGIHFRKRSGQLEVEGRGQHGETNETVKSEFRVMSCLSGHFHYKSTVALMVLHLCHILSNVKKVIFLPVY